VTQDFYQGAFEYLPHGAAILDGAGTIIAVNGAWRRFACDNGGRADGYVGTNYLATCRQADEEEAALLGDALQRFLAGQQDSLEWEYPCHSPQERRWFLMKAAHFAMGEARYVLVSHLDITQRRLAEEAALEKAHYDPLTGLLNRNSFPERLQQTLALARRRNETFAVLFLDLDGFKAINDRFGHERGDALLTELGHRLRKNLRDADAVARLGGDEFVLLVLPGDKATARRVAKRLHRLVAAAASRAEVAGLVSGSVGISFFPEHGRDGDTLLEQADHAMYRAKRQGKDGTAEAPGAAAGH
jgi:diguanylate cyclase (GGDEF)-like protein